MADVVRTSDQLTTLFADNSAGDITAQDGRDFIVSSFGYIGSTDPNGNYDNVDTAGIGAFFDAGSKLLNTTSGGKVWECTSGTPTMATWVQLYPQGSSISITAGSGISVSPSPITGTGTVSANLTSSDVPSLPASKITSGTFSASQIPSLNSIASSSGSLNASNLGSGYPYADLSGSPSSPSSGGGVLTGTTTGTSFTTIYDTGTMTQGLLIGIGFLGLAGQPTYQYNLILTDVRGNTTNGAASNSVPSGSQQTFSATAVSFGVPPAANGPLKRVQIQVNDLGSRSNYNISYFWIGV
jgi:hypothetical protein